MYLLVARDVPLMPPLTAISTEVFCEMEEIEHKSASNINHPKPETLKVMRNSTN